MKSPITKGDFAFFRKIFMPKVETMDKKDKVLLTAEGIKKLKGEYDNLVNSKRKEVTEKIAKAREFGDLSENSEYDTAREEQSFIEGRIMELEEILAHAKPIDTSHTHSSVEIGSRVKVHIDGEEDEFVIVSSVEANPMEGKISNESPVGKALLGSKVGDVVTVSSTVKATYKVLDIK